MIKGYEDALLQELYGGDVRGQDQWNPLYQPDKQVEKPGIDLADPYKPAITKWFDPTSVHLVMAPARKILAVSEITDELSSKDPVKVQAFLGKVIEAIDGNALDAESMQLIGSQVDTLKLIFDDYKRVSKQETDILELGAVLKQILNMVSKKIHALTPTAV